MTIFERPSEFAMGGGGVVSSMAGSVFRKVPTRPTGGTSTTIKPTKPRPQRPN